MAFASVLVGICAGFASLLAALIAGQGIVVAAGLYVFGGLVGIATVIAIGLGHDLFASLRRRFPASYEVAR